MKYACLVYGDEQLMRTVSDAECLENGAVMKSAGQYLGGEALQPVRSAVTVRLRDGAVSITDGPFAETKEQLGGFYMVDCKDLDEALKWAAEVPSASRGPVEVRPIMDFPQA